MRKKKLNPWDLIVRWNSTERSILSEKLRQHQYKIFYKKLPPRARHCWREIKVYISLWHLPSSDSWREGWKSYIYIPACDRHRAEEGIRSSHIIDERMGLNLSPRDGHKKCETSIRERCVCYRGRSEDAYRRCMWQKNTGWSEREPRKEAFNLRRASEYIASDRSNSTR